MNESDWMELREKQRLKHRLLELILMLLPTAVILLIIILLVILGDG